jgi:hypothetical protein
LVAEEQYQEERESRRLWSGLTEGIKNSNQDKATDEKSKIEEKERLMRKEREEKNVQWETRFFDYDGEDAVFKLLKK